MDTGLTEDDLDVPDTPTQHRMVVEGAPVRPELAHPASVTVLCRLESYRSGTPQLTKQEMKLRFATWQIWELCQKSYARAAKALGRWRGRSVTRQHVFYIIRCMRQQGILDGVR